MLKKQGIMKLNLGHKITISLFILTITLGAGAYMQQAEAMKEVLNGKADKAVVEAQYESISADLTLIKQYLLTNKP